MNKLSPLKKQHIILVASRLLSYGGMNFSEDNKQAERLYEALVNACDNSGAHDEAVSLASSIIPNFNY